MQLVSVNLGEERKQKNGQRLETTGIYKLPVSQPVQIHALGLENDVVCDSRNHGGPDQAVYLYGLPDYRWWSAELGTELAPGTFGENLTIEGLESARFNIGDRLHFDRVVLEVSAPRIPCGTLAARMGDPMFVKRYRAAERPGLYCRVIQPGPVQAGEQVRLEPHAAETISVVEMFREFYVKDKSEETLQRHLRAPIAARARHDLEKELGERPAP